MIFYNAKSLPVTVRFTQCSFSPFLFRLSPIISRFFVCNNRNLSRFPVNLPNLSAYIKVVCGGGIYAKPLQARVFCFQRASFLLSTRKFFAFNVQVFCFNRLCVHFECRFFALNAKCFYLDLRTFSFQSATFLLKTATCAL